MPYIQMVDRQRIEPVIEPMLREAEGYSLGELNYIITRLIHTALGRTSYARIAELTGVLENVKQEFYRRKAAPYEDTKIAENGDV